MRVAHRRTTTVRCLTALTLGLLALTGCSGQDDGPDDGQAATATASATASVASTTPAPSSDGTDPSTAPSAIAPSATAASGTAARWAGTKQFVQIDGARTADGRTYLSVRPAEKKPHPQFEAWVIVPGEGPYTEVSMTEDAQVLLSVPLGDAKHPAAYAQDEFVSRLSARPSPDRALLGYDLSFDGQGRVTRVQSLYTP
ncbi:hypothetical protein C4J65_15370 [Streptomyces sp. CB09001]|uniref:hypothetical protein n=1 Tax=Streptomyces sp. CB09001 TaxID=2083284 RepID=UPI000E215B0C|nr:hypothetical protein [Streptomyces sp. CB09001]AXL89518.1 hypothetical protein C4J65_15370 [Streptomyces sp. CB09001]